MEQENGKRGKARRQKIRKKPRQDEALDLDLESEKTQPRSPPPNKDKPTKIIVR